MELLIENKKIFKILFVVTIVVVLTIIWWPKTVVELSYYDEISEDEIYKKAAKQYGNDLQYAFYLQDMSLLQDKISSEYLEYNQILSNNYINWLRQNGFITFDIKFNNSKKYEYGDKIIYSIDTTFSGEAQQVNIIETYPEKWYYTFDTFVDFKNEQITKEQDGKGVIVSNIYQDLNYIEFDCGMYIDDETNKDIEVTRMDSIKLYLDDKTAFVMATNNINSESSIVDGKKFVNMKCIFNIPIEMQIKIDKLVFNTFKINEDIRNIEIDLDI